MLVKVVEDSQLGRIEYHRLPNQKSIRLSCKPNLVRVSFPRLVRLKKAERFVKDRKDWLKKNVHSDVKFYNGLKFGRNQKLTINDNQVGFSIKNNNVVSENNPEVVRQAVLAALKKEAEDIFPKKVAHWQKKTGYLFEVDLKIKPMRSRWGSCQSQKRRIALNSLLVQLDDSLVDYVIIHELCHFDIRNHSSKFYQLVESFCPDYRLRQAQLQQIRPVIKSRS